MTDVATRRLQHQKTSRSLVKTGLPALSELVEGISVVRIVPGKGVYEFFRVGNQRYYHQLTEGIP